MSTELLLRLCQLVVSWRLAEGNGFIKGANENENVTKAWPDLGHRRVNNDELVRLSSVQGMYRGRADHSIQEYN